MPDLTYGQEDLTQETGFFIVEYVHTQRLECKLHSFLPSHSVPAYKTKQASLYWQLLQQYVPDFSE